MNSFTHLLPLRRSTLLISAAIFTMATAQAEIQIGRLPSVHPSDGQVIGAKPNVFLAIDNSMFMARSNYSTTEVISPNANYLQQTAAALIASLPQLEGKVRLGFSTALLGNKSHSGSTFSCKDLKLNGNVNHVASYIPSLKADLVKNKNYVTGNNDFVFGVWPSGYGETTPRDFRDNYARYIYSWLGAMCPGDTSNRGQELPRSTPPVYTYKSPADLPPYGDLRDPTAYQAAAKAAGNEFSIPLINFSGTNIFRKSASPTMDIYARILGEVADKHFLCSVTKQVNDGKKRSCGLVDVYEENDSSNVTLRTFPMTGKSTIDLFKYDAYAPSRPDNGYPDDKNPLSCRKNYTIMISYSPYSKPDHFSDNTWVGTDDGGLNGGGSWNMPNGKNLPIAGHDALYTRQYRYLPLERTGLSDHSITSFKAGNGKFNIWKIPKDSYKISTRSYSIQGAAGGFLFSKLALRSYYSDLRTNLKDDVKPFYASKNPRPEGINNEEIPPFWDRKNDVANWQNMVLFTLGFKEGFYSWNRAKIYEDNFKVDPKDGDLEAYFRAIESGTIYKDNAPIYDWGRGGFGPDLDNRSNPGVDSFGRYIYRHPDGKTEKYVIQDESQYYSSWTRDQHLSKRILNALDALAEMDYAKAAINTRGGAYMITDYNSIKNIISTIASRIETAMAQGISGGAIGGGSRVTASQQAAGGNDSTLFTTYLEQENISGNIFAFKNCPLIQEKIPDGNGGLKTNPTWEKNSCGKRLWNAATALKDDVDQIADKTIIPIKDSSALSGATFKWDNLDQELKAAFTSGGNETLGQARVNWLNGQETFGSTVSGKLRQRATIAIPDEKQHYSYNDDGTLKKDDEGNLVLAKPTNITNLMGEIVYALPKAVDSRGTLPAAHPLNNQAYGDFLNAKVKNRKPMVLAGSNDGRLYGFNTANSGENASLAFSFIPRSVVLKQNNNIVDFTKPDATAKAAFADGLVNGPFTVKDAQVNGQWGTYVVGTLGEGGDAIYALDISTGLPSSNMFKWEISGRGYGNIMAEPRIVWLRNKKATSNEADGKWVVLLPTGYNGDTVSLIVLDLADGTELAKIDTHAKYQEASSNENNKTCSLASSADGITLEENVSVPKSLTCDNGLGALTVFDADSDSGADFVFAGDLMGHVWKFDLTGFFDKSGNQASDLQTALKVAYNSPLFIAQTPGNNSTRQPITNMITIEDGAYGEGSMLYFGTGRMFNQRERELKQQESFYGVWDIPRYSEQGNIAGFALPLRRDGSNSQYDFIRYKTFVIPASDVKDPNSSLTKFEELRGVKRTDTLTSSNYLSYNLQGQPTSNEKVVGWIIDFPSEDALERVINRAYAFEDTIFFPTFTPKGGAQEESCEPIRTAVGGDARFYMVDRLTGGQPETSPFDFNHDGTQDDNDGVKVNPSDLGKGGNLNDLGYNRVPGDDGKISLSPAGVLIGSGNGDFLSVTGVLERSKQATNKYNCDYSRQVVFPSTVDPKTGNPLVLSSCNRNRYRVWKQPIIE